MKILFTFHEEKMFNGTLPFESLIKELSFEDIINVCSTKREYSRVCNDPRTWEFLLERDFQAKAYTNDPRKEYLQRKQYPYYQTFGPEHFIRSMPPALPDQIWIFEANGYDYSLYLMSIDDFRKEEYDHFTWIKKGETLIYEHDEGSFVILDTPQNRSLVRVQNRITF